MMKLKRNNRDAQKKRSSHKVRGVSPEAGKQSVLWERSVKEVGLETHEDCWWRA